MLIHDIKESADRRLNRLTRLLDDMYGLQIDFEGSPESHLRHVYEHYSAQRNELARGFGVATDPSYAKAVLISEAVRLYLREIAPKRTKKKKGPKGAN